MINKNKSFYYGLSAVFLWSTSATAIKLALDVLDVFQLLFFSTFTSAIILCSIVCYQGRRTLFFDVIKTKLSYFLGMAILNPLVFYFLLFSAYGRLPAQQAQTINYTWAITLGLLSVPLLGQRLGKVDFLAMSLGYFGVVIIATQGSFLSLKFSDELGVFLALSSTIVWALYWIINAAQKLDPVVGLAINFIFATPFAFVLTLLFSDSLAINLDTIFPAIYIGICEMGVAYVFWIFALRKTTSISRVGNLIFLSPVLSLIFIALILNETIQLATLIGLVLIIPGIYLQNKKSQAK
ncbi:MAG: DMT family transporter [Halieaceae bacterium]|nr:DMT family transporter [Halieaceae bacterium]